MATTNVTLTGAWTLLATGPTTTDGTVSAYSQVIELAIATSTPAATVTGFKSYKSDPYCFSLNTGENLYGRAASPAQASLTILNT